MSDAWKPNDRATEEPPHHYHHHHHHRTIGVGKPHVPPHVDTHAGIAHTSEQLIRVENKLDALLDLIRQRPPFGSERPTSAN